MVVTLSAGWWGRIGIGMIVSSYSTGDADGGGGDDDRVGGLVGLNSKVVRLCRAIPLAMRTVVVMVGANDDCVGGLVGWEFVGGLVGANVVGLCRAIPLALRTAVMVVTMSAGWWGENGGAGTIVSSYSTGAADGGDGSGDRVGGLVGSNQW